MISKGYCARLLGRARTKILMGWTQGAEARAKDGRKVLPTSSFAIEWSLFGAVLAEIKATATSPTFFDIEREVLRLLLHEVTGAYAGSIGSYGTGRVTPASIKKQLEDWNDDQARTKIDVLQALARAAEAASTIRRKEPENDSCK